MAIQQPWFENFFAHWRQYAAAYRDQSAFYAILEQIEPKHPRVPTNILQRSRPADARDQALVELWTAWNAFLADDWSRAIQKVDDICERYPDRQEPYIFVAVMHLALGGRRRGVVGIQKALESDPENEALRQLLALLGIRRPPVVPFLSRDSRINIFLGKLRHRILGPQRGSFNTL